MGSITIGMDLGDRYHQVCILDKKGNVIKVCQVSNTQKAIEKFFRGYAGATVAIEAGTHSPWVSRELEGCGCKVFIGNPRKLKVIWSSTQKSDVRDAEMLARIARFDPGLLSPIRHRGEQAQADLAMIKARDVLVRTRTGLVNHVRGILKSMGIRIPSCGTPNFAKKARGHLPDILLDMLLPVIDQIEAITEKIEDYDRKIRMLSERRYPETFLLSQVPGVGPITSLAFILTLEDPQRFEKSRQVGVFLGLTPRRDQSGQTDKQLRITKAGNSYLRQLLVSCAHHILGPFGPDSELRRFGLRIASSGGKNAKRRAVVAVARKLSVLLHRLWVTGEAYDPFYKSHNGSTKLLRRVA